MRVKHMENECKLNGSKFLNSNELTFEQLTDPDFRLKQIKKLVGNEKAITCSKCHHCR
jgi:hypothetical protein